MKRNKRRLIAALLCVSVIVLGGCATVYQQEGVFTNGYSDYSLSADTFVVTFRASEHTSKDKVIEYALRRAAELTLKQGFHYFSILETNDSGKHLHYPSLRLKIQCYHFAPIDREWIDATEL